MSTDHAKSPPKKIIVTMGDPLGIGPELCLKLAGDRAWLQRTGAALTIAGSLQILEHVGESLGLEAALKTVHAPLSEPGETGVIDTPIPLEKSPGAKGPTAAGGHASVLFIESAVREVLCGRADAIVTCPISKKALSAAGSQYPGHTEMIGELAGGARKPVMMMLSEQLKVAFVTTHTAMKNLPLQISTAKVVHTGRIFAGALSRYFGITAPELAICAFNPHAGDAGRFGDEEEKTLQPAIRQLCDSGVNAVGPLPSDSLFYTAAQGEYNGIIALYHDQGMIPVKMQGPDRVVNITIGLPLIRTSPAHGTAYDIAGKGVANPASLKNAVSTAASMAAVDREKNTELKR